MVPRSSNSLLQTARMQDLPVTLTKEITSTLMFLIRIVNRSLPTGKMLRVLTFNHYKDAGNLESAFEGPSTYLTPLRVRQLVGVENMLTSLLKCYLIGEGQRSKSSCSASGPA
jgi:hypothetical protein